MLYWAIEYPLDQNSHQYSQQVRLVSYKIIENLRLGLVISYTRYKIKEWEELETDDVSVSNAQNKHFLNSVWGLAEKVVLARIFSILMMARLKHHPSLTAI